jgi:hypothetical protein
MMSIASTFTIDTCGANMLFKWDESSPFAPTSSVDHTKSQLILAGEGGLIVPMLDNAHVIKVKRKSPFG